MPRLAALLLVFACAAPVTAQTFDVVSVKPHPAEQAGARYNSSTSDRPDGSLTMTNMPAALFISRAYGIAPANMAGLPGWAMSDRFDLIATASLTNPTADQRTAMLRAVLADRFKFVAHVEQREQPSYDLVLARKDGTLGRGLRPIETDCAKAIAERTAALATGGPPPPREFPNFDAPPPSCTLRSVGAPLRARGATPPATPGSLLEGETTIPNLADFLRVAAARPVKDRTGLTGSYRVTMNYDDLFRVRRGPDIDPVPDAAPSVFVALTEQLGLKLESSKTMVDTLVIDRLERPTEN
jgi:uncharacterized protein (TIGR03435 family)